MNQLIILADIGTDLANTGAQTARTFGVDVPHLISQIISFCIVAALLYFFAYKRILQVLEERRQRIAGGLANADKIKAELARTEASRQDVLAQANAQANKLIEEARAALDKAIGTAPAAFRLNVEQRPPWMGQDVHDHMLEGLRKAGWGKTGLKPDR